MKEPLQSILHPLEMSECLITDVVSPKYVYSLLVIEIVKSLLGSCKGGGTGYDPVPPTGSQPPGGTGWPEWATPKGSQPVRDRTSHLRRSSGRESLF